MVRRVFFSFHFENDIWRVNQVRNSNVVAGADRAGFFDHSEYLEAKKKGADNVKRLIRAKLKGTSVTVVLIGEETARRRFVRYEIEQSIAQGNGLLGIFIDHLKVPDDPEYVPLLSELDDAVEDVVRAVPFLPELRDGVEGVLGFTPEIPEVPDDVEFPTYRWDGDLDRFADAIEEAGQRSEEEREQ